VASTGAKQASLPSSTWHHWSRVRAAKMVVKRRRSSGQAARSSKSGRPSTSAPAWRSRPSSTARNFFSIGATDTYSPSAQR
jgi:hypothetical protein